MNEKEFIQEIISNELDYCFRDCSQDNIDKWVEILNRYKKQLLLHNVVNTLLCDDNIAKMACEYTESESEYQAFILACQVIAEKMQL